MYVVYALKSSIDTSEVRYVGICHEARGIERALARRLRAHLRLAELGKGLPSSTWIRSLEAPPVAVAFGMVPRSKAFSVDRSDSNVRAIEAFWIRALLRDGHRLTNLQNTGISYRRREVEG